MAIVRSTFPIPCGRHLAGAALAIVLCATGLAAAAAPLSPHDVELLDAVSWGANSSSAAELRTLGAHGWLEHELAAPPAPLPADIAARIAALPVSRTPPATLVRDWVAKLGADKDIADPEARKAAAAATVAHVNDIARQAATRSILQALYGPNQLRERLTWFWLNHFNVHQYKADLRLLVGDYEENAIRPNVLGRFRDLLEATLKHPAMLDYLDNAGNSVGHVNENYAREIMELHTMGVGSGYTQKDVEELARILTGVGVDRRPELPRLRPELQGQLIRDGLFEFNPARHDYGDKIFLGHTIKGRGFAEVEEALDILCREPATARHVSRALATYFVADQPSEPLVQKMAAEFGRTDGSIAATLRVMFSSPEFEASLGKRFKDPVRYVYSAIRLAYDDKQILNTTPIQGWLNRLGEGLFNHQTPDGYPLTSDAWTASGQMAVRFEIAHQIGSGSAGLFKGEEAGVPDRPAFPLLQNALYFAVLKDTLGESTRAALDRAVSPQEWNTLFLSSPEFMR